MGIMSWDLDVGFSSVEPLRNPRLTVRCDYPDTPFEPTVVTFGLSPRYGIDTAREARAWFLAMVREHEAFEVETDEPDEPPLSFWSETVRSVMVVE